MNVTLSHGRETSAAGFALDPIFLDFDRTLLVAALNLVARLTLSFSGVDQDLEVCLQMALLALDRGESPVAKVAGQPVLEPSPEAVVQNVVVFDLDFNDVIGALDDLGT